RSKGMLPTSFFIADLMKFLGKDYYVGLSTAAAFYGAAHQQPQEFYVITTKPTLRPINTGKLSISFFFKKEWHTADVKEHKVETGYINISSPELTALDLITYFDRVGGLNRVATVLDELAEGMNNTTLAEAARGYGNTATLQRLGYLLEILEKHSLAETLAEVLKGIKHFPVLLRPQKGERSTMVTGNTWKVAANTKIEADL
ncbi:MAG TPA: type IV toxin-antitoxin system AbiEi family antitoxin, partial [Flavisolibacter sp.]|nr:type IV toxin-antitoxin system AbiEi family antitoxin [Flavisolibacter sp.]